MRVRQHTAGFSLVELMIAMVLGLLVVGSAIGIFLANHRTYDSADSLSKLQENARTAFELMARDIREAGGSACDSTLQPANMLNGGAAWWSSPSTGLQGYANGALPGSAADTDALAIISATDAESTLGANMSASDGAISLTAAPGGVAAGDVLLICDFQCATIFQASGVAGTTVEHWAAGGVTPGNAEGDLTCAATAPNLYPRSYAAGAVVARVGAVEWMIKTVDGHTSLYRVPVAAGVAGTPQEIARGIVDMNLTYLVPTAVPADGNYVDATVVTDWSQVTAVRIELTLQGTPAGPGGAQTITRTMSQTVTLRNREVQT